MDFALSADQEALRDGVRAFCENRIDAATLRRLEGSGFDRELWRDLALLGVFGLRIAETKSPERAGDEGSTPPGVAEAVLVFEALGRALAPGPILWTHLAAGLVPGAATGDTVVAGIAPATRADSGRPLVLEHLACADALLVLRENGVERLDARRLVERADPAAKPLDPLTPIHRIAELPAGELVADADAAARLRLEGTTLSAAILLGIAEETLALATRYACERQQFDRPIGSFQAIKHMLADGYVRQELARASVYAAGVLLDESSEAAGASVATARRIAGEAAMKNARACIQVHGGMGFTWESPVHYYLKRAWILGNGFG